MKERTICAAGRLMCFVGGWDPGLLFRMEYQGAVVSPWRYVGFKAEGV